MMAQMHPKNNNRFIAALFQKKPVIVDIVGTETVRTELPTEPDDKDDSSKATSYVTALAWNKAGSRIYTGNSKGYLHIIDVESNKIIHSSRVGSTTIKGIQWSRNGRDLLINANDRQIRYFRLDPTTGFPKLHNKFQDLVNRIQWSQSCFSSDGEFVIGGSGHKAEHNIYIWDKNMGNLVKILEGPKEPLDDLAWHPVRPIIASVSSFGNIYIWTTKHEENWSAFAPDFIELEENVEYEEKEDEFDVVPDEEKTKQKQEEEDISIDVTTCDSIQAFIDPDDEADSDEVFYLSSLPFIDDIVQINNPQAAHTEEKMPKKKPIKKKKKASSEIADERPRKSLKKQ
ncbi:quinon protein alcohol dehydrogenase-like superfamily [Parasitella parasitica]|nr:quinon protein alcohol dehydrogenase-like superfamily [Parasitella parasitica]